jgi:hypothetical protein
LPSAGGEHPLRKYLEKINMTETTALNHLQEQGIISDNCITIDDVGNWARAMMWLHERKAEGRI